MIKEDGFWDEIWKSESFGLVYNVGSHLLGNWSVDWRIKFRIGIDVNKIMAANYVVDNWISIKDTNNESCSKKASLGRGRDLVAGMVWYRAMVLVFQRLTLTQKYTEYTPPALRILHWSFLLKGIYSVLLKLFIILTTRCYDTNSATLKL